MTTVQKAITAILVTVLIAIFLIALALQGDVADLPLEQTAGTDPVLAEEESEIIPTVAIAEPVGWASGEQPIAAPGLEVNRFADNLDHPRVIYTLSNGDVLVTLTRSPGFKPGDDDGGVFATIRSWVESLLFSQAGAAGASPNQLVLLRDTNEDGRADRRFVLTDELDSPSGIAWQDNTLFVANHDEVLTFPYNLGDTSLGSPPTKLMDLPPGGGHWMRNIKLGPAGRYLYVAVGSVSNIGESGMEVEEGRAMIWRYDLETGRQSMFAAGLRNPNGLDFSPWTGELWTTVNERDMLGSDLVPDYLTNVPIGAQYGWPWLYWRDNIDQRVDAPMPQYLMEYTRRPEYALGAHVAPLGFVFTEEGSRMGDNFPGGAFVANHGSWNRKPPSGYNVVFVNFDENGNPQGLPKTVLGGFLQDDGTTRGRPTWVAWSQDGALLVTDDTAGIIWRVVDPNAKPASAIARVERGRLQAPSQLQDPEAARREAYARETMEN